MAVVKRVSKLLGLKNLDVLVEDTLFDSKYFRILECPVILTQGKSSFLIGGSSFLKPGVEVKVELVHNETEETIYTEPVRSHLEGDLRRVSIEVYSDVKPGSYTLYIVGELDPATSDVPIPSEWQNIYNVRWSKQITVNGIGVNTQPIYFHKQPSIIVSELFTGFVQIPPATTTNIYLTGSGDPRPGLNSIAPVENVTGAGFGTSTYPELDFANKAKLSIIEENKPLVKLSGKHGLIGAQGQQVQSMSPVLNDYVITVSGDSYVNTLYVGYNITINSPQVDTTQFTLESYHEVPSTYSSTVMKVLTDRAFVPKDVFYIYDNRTSPATLVPAPFTSTYPISASYLSFEDQTTSEINHLSFGDIQISDLRTFSGDVHKIKIYAKSEGSLGDFELIYDSPVESSQVLYDKNEATLLNNMGYWLNSTRINNYWEAYEGLDGTISGTLAFNASVMMDSMLISGSNKEYEDTLRIQHKTAVDFIKGNLYTFRAELYGIKRDKKDIDGVVGTAAEFKVYVTGDAFNKIETTANHWGTEKLTVPDFPDGVSEYDFGYIEGNFIADNTETGTIQFKVPSGEWYISDISVKASSDTAFNPDYVRIKAPVPALLERPDRLRFLAEFYDVNNNIADSIIFSEPITFQGPNINISGTGNILSGSMVIGDSLYSGIEMAGVSSAFVRSLGYFGFSSASNAQGTNSGFFMWSGSVLPDSGDNYAGVGLELVGTDTSYFRFRTDPSDLDIRADSFFVGNENSQFVSGSGGNVEISSSNFHLSASGDVTMQGTITAEAGNIGDWKIIDGKLSGSNATLDAVGAALYKTDASPDSNPLDGYYIDFTPGSNYYIRMGTDFAVSASGQLFASGAKIEGVLTASEGYIANWTIAPNTIHKLTSTKYTGLSSTGDTRFFAGADSLTATGSARFNVKHSGQVTGSNVLFTGGKVGGWTLTDTTLTGGVVTLNSSGSIEVGGLADATTTATTNSGFFADSSGNVLIKGNVSDNDYLKISAGGGIDIKSQVFDLNAGTVVIDSAANSGKIALGTTPNTSIAGTNKGVYMDGVGNFLVRGDASNYFKFDASAASIDIKTDTFDLDAGTLIVESATNNGKIALGEIPPTAFNSGNGIYMDGNANLLIGSASADHIQYNAGSSTFDVKVGSLELDASNIEISSVNASMSLGEGNILLDGANSKVTVGSTSSKQITLQGHADYGYIATGKSSATDTTKGFWLANNNADPEFHVGNATDFLKFDGGELDIQSQKLEISSSTIQISSTNASMSLGHSTTYPRGRIILEGAGTPTFTAGTDADWISMSTGSGVYIDGDGNFKFGDDDGNVAFQNGSFSITGSDVDINVTEINITADGFQLSSPEASMSLGTNRQWLAYGGDANPYMSIGMGGSGSYGDDGLWLAYNDTLGKPRVSFVGSTGHFKFTGTDLDIKTGTLALAASGIQLSSAQASMSLGGVPGAAANITLDGGNSNIVVGSANSVTIQGGTVDNFIVMGNKANFDDYDKSTTGIILGMDSTIPSFEMAKNSSDYLRWDSTDGLDMQTTKMEVSASNIQISSTQASMSIGDPSSTGGAVVLQSQGTDKMLRFGDKTTFDQDSVDGLIMGINGSDNKPELDFTIGTSDNQYVRMTSAGIFMRVPNFELDTATFDISSANKRLSVFKSAASGSEEVVRLGEISEAAGDLYGIKIYDGTQGTYSDDGHPNTLVMFGEQGNKIGGWEITNGQIRSIPNAGFGGQFAEGETGLILQASGSIETSDFVTGLKGWRISALGNGSAEFENARIRGTLRTTVFEKESVNVVGGQLMVANSTTLDALKDVSGSIIAGVASMSAADVTMSVANVSGFRAGEILKAKRVDDTGFTVEYLYVTGSMRYTHPSSSVSESIRNADMGAMDPDGLAGELYLGRGYGQNNVISSSVGTLDAASPAGIDDSETDITLSTGTGYAIQSILKIDEERMKVVSHSTGGGIIVVRDFHDTTAATHSDGATVYVVDPDAEFLSGLVSTAQAYNEGQVIVSTGVYEPEDDISSGYILMNANPNDISTPYMDVVERTGSGVYDLQLRTRIGDLSGLSSAYLYGDEEPGFGIYTENGFFKGTLHAMTGSIHGILHVATVQGGIETGQKISIGRKVGAPGGAQGDGIYINNNNYWFTDAEWRVGDETNYLHLTGSGGNLGNDLSIQLEKFELNAGSGDLKISSTEKSMSFGNGDIIFQSYDATNSWGRIGATSNKAIFITGSSTDGVIRSGKTSVTSNTAGFWLANTDGDQEFVVGDSTDYIRYSGSAVDIQTRAFELVAGNGDLIISSGEKSMSLADGQIFLDGSQTAGYIRVGNAPVAKDNIQISGSNTLAVIKAGITGSYADGVSTGDNGFILERALTTTKFHVGSGTEYIRFDGTNIDISAANFNLTASNVNITAGDGMEVDAPDFEISTLHKSMSLGYTTNATYGVTMVGASNSYISFGPKSSPNFQLYSAGETENYLKIGSQTFGGTEGGVILGEASNGVYGLDMYKDADEYFRFSTGPGGLDIRTLSMSLVTPGLTIHGVETLGASNYIKLGSATSATGGEGVWMDGGGSFRVGTATTATGPSYMYFNSGDDSLTVKTDTLILDTAKIDIDSRHGGMIALGASSASLSDLSSNGIFLSGSGEFNLQKDSSNYLRYTITGGMDIKATAFDLLAGTGGGGQVGVNTDRIALGATLPTGDGGSTGDGIGFYVSSSGHMLLGNAASGQPKITWDGSNVTLVGTLRQTLAGSTITDYVDRGTWAVATAYAVNDLVQHASGGNTSTYKCLVAHTSADPAGSDGTTGTPNVATTGWGVYVQGSTGATGTPAALLTINADSQVFAFDDSNDTSPTPATIAVSASQQNQSSDLIAGDLTTTNGLAIEGGSGSNFYYDGGSGTGNASWTVTPGGTYPVTCVVSNDSLSDTVTLHKIVGGDSAASPKLLSLESSGYVYVKAIDGTLAPTDVSFTASLQNTTNTNATWSSSPSVTLTAGVNENHKKLTSANFGSNTNVIITATVDDSYSDSTTVHLVDEGSGNVQSVLSNPAHTFQANSVGTVSSFTGGGTTIKCYEGATELTFETTAADVSAGEFSASIDRVRGGITPGTFSGDTLTSATLAPPSAMTADNGEIRMTITGSTLNNTLFEFPVTQSFAKSKAAAPAITTILSNETHTFQGTTGGVVSDFTNSGTTISVYEGTSAVLYDGTGTANSRFSSSAVGSNIVPGGETDSGDYVTYGVASAQTANTPSSITYTINGTDSEGSTFTQTKVQTFSISNAGATGTGVNAKLVSLEASSLVFRKATDGTFTPAVASFTSSLQNTGDTTATFTSSPSVTLTEGIDANHQGLSAANFGTNTNVTITATADTSFTDSATIILVDEGSGNVQSVLSNPAHTFQANSSETVSDFSGGGTDIKCYEGATELTFEATEADVSAGEFSASIDSTSGGITPGTFSGDGTATATLAAPSAMTALIGEIRMTVTGSTLNNTEFEFPVTQSFAKSVAGIAGATAKTVVVTPDAYFFVSASDGSVSPASITISGSTQNTTVDGAWSTSAGTLTDEVNTHTEASTKVTSGNFIDGMQVTYTLASDGGINDTVTLRLLDEGSGTVQAILTNQAHTFQANSSETVSDFSGGGTGIKCYEGATALTFEEASASLSAGEFSASIDSISGGITPGTFSGDGTVTATLAAPSAMTALIGELRMTVTGSTLNNTEFEFPVTQSFAKSVAGTTAKGIQLILESNTISFDNSTGTAVLSPAVAVQDIICSANLQNISGTPTYSILTSAGASQTDLLFIGDGGDGVITAATATIDASTWSSIDLGESVQIKVELTDGSAYSDTQSVYALFSGETGDDAVVSLLTNESFTAGAPSTGIATDFTGGTGTMKVFEGTTDDSANWAFTGTNTYNGLICTVTDTAAGGEYVLSGTWTAATTSETFTITGSKGGYSSQYKDFSVSKTLAGASVTGDSGAGIVYRGEHSASVDYSGNSDRKDVVKGTDNEYWIAKSDHTSLANEDDKPITGTEATYEARWEEFGASFTSVATDILFAQDVYADYTVNIGTENSSPVIALNSDAGNSHANPYIGIGGATAFANAQGDIFIGYDSGNSSAPSISLGTTLKMVAGANAAATTLTLGAATAIGTGNGIYMDGSGDAFRVGDAGGTRMQWDGDNVEIYGGATKMVSLGNLNWIAGWTIAADKLSAGTDADYIALMPGTSGYAIQVGDSTFADAKFSVTEAGVIKAISGTVGGWTLSSTTLTSNDVEISNTGKIRMGSSLPNSATDGTGFYADGDRNFLVGSSAGNHLQYLAAGTVDIQSTQFNLNATTVIIDSSAADGKIQLGPSGGPGSATGTSNAGAYLDGTGKFNFGDGTGNYIRFNATGLEVNTDNLTIDSDGDVEITGNITVTNNSDFADLSQGSQLYESFGTYLDTTKWITANLTQSMHTETPDGATYNHSRFWNDTGDAWDAGFWSNTKFLRSEASSMEFDIAVNEQHPALFIGFYDGDAVLGDLNSATNYYHMTEGLYFQTNAIHAYSDHDNNGTVSLQSTLESPAWVTDTDAFYRCRITLKPAGGANFQVFKNGVYNTPHLEHNTVGNTKAEHRVGICVHYDNSTDSGGRFPMFNQIGANRSVATTIISGDGITTGKLTSTNYDSSNGSQIDLDAGTAVFGGSDGTGITFAANGDITSTEYLVERSRLFGGGEDGNGTCITGTGGAAQCDSRITNTASSTWTLQSDVYAENLTVNSSVTLKTNGYRLFVRNILLNNGTIKNDGGDGSGRTTRGDGGTGNTLAAGVRGATGGSGGEAGGGGGSPGGDGGASGGSGGHVMIFARTVTNNGTIRACGGIGAPGSPVGAPL